MPSGATGLRVRAGPTPGEEIVTLDGVTRCPREHGPRETGQSSLRQSDCLICDAGDRPVGIGGIMGGQSSEITSEASRVLLEVASFLPPAVARTARWLGLRTEASVRFERGVDPLGVERGRRFVSVSSWSMPPGRPAWLRLLSLRGFSTRTLCRTCHVEFGLELRGSPHFSAPRLRSRDSEIASLLRPLGFVVGVASGSDGLDGSSGSYTSAAGSEGSRRSAGSDASRRSPGSEGAAATGALDVEVPSFRPDVSTRSRRG